MSSMGDVNATKREQQWDALYSAIVRKADLLDALHATLPRDWCNQISAFARSIRRDGHLMPHAMTTMLLDVAVHIQRRLNSDSQGFLDQVAHPVRGRRSVSDRRAHQECEACLLRWVESRETAALVQHVQAVRIADYINKNLSTPLSLQHLAKMSGWASHDLSRCFSAVFGIPIRRYIAQQRMRKAAELMRAGSKVEAAMWDVGYRNKTHFCRTFFKHVGLRPRQCRETVVGAVVDRQLA